MPEHDLTRTDRMALYIRARADAKAARDEAVRVVEGENAALSEVPCGRRPSARAKGLGASCGRRDRACRSHGHRPRQGVALFVGRAGEQHWVPAIRVFAARRLHTASGQDESIRACR